MKIPPCFHSGRFCLYLYIPVLSIATILTLRTPKESGGSSGANDRIFVRTKSSKVLLRADSLSRSRTANGTDFVVYSLRTHEAVRRLSLIGLESFAVSSRFIILVSSTHYTVDHALTLGASSVHPIHQHFKLSQPVHSRLCTSRLPHLSSLSRHHHIPLHQQSPISTMYFH